MKLQYFNNLKRLDRIWGEVQGRLSQDRDNSWGKAGHYVLHMLSSYAAMR